MKMGELHLLVAEDNDFQRKTLVRMLRTLGVTSISEAGDGKAALDIFAAADPPIDIIISDLEMPGMDGMEFMRHLGQADRPVSVVLSSALDEALISSVELMTRAYGITVLGALSKPVTLDRLRGLVETFAPPRSKVPGQAAPQIPIDEMRRGLAAGEFEPFFQPKVNLADGTVVGMEALARWRHPRMGLVAPSAFIPPMESAGLIDDLTWRMLENSAARCREWVEGGLKWTVSVDHSLCCGGGLQFRRSVVGVQCGTFDCDTREIDFPERGSHHIPQPLTADRGRQCCEPLRVGQGARIGADDRYGQMRRRKDVARTVRRAVTAKLGEDAAHLLGAATRVHDDEVDRRLDEFQRGAEIAGGVCSWRMLN